MTETKQDVFNEVVDGYNDMFAASDIRGYRARYAAAAVGNPDCPYCHKSGRHTNMYGLIPTNKPYYQRISRSVRAGQTLLYTAVRSTGFAVATPINFCPMCGRHLSND